MSTPSRSDEGFDNLFEGDRLDIPFTPESPASSDDSHEQPSDSDMKDFWNESTISEHGASLAQIQEWFPHATNTKRLLRLVKTFAQPEETSDAHDDEAEVIYRRQPREDEIVHQITTELAEPGSTYSFDDLFELIYPHHAVDVDLFYNVFDRLTRPDLTTGLHMLRNHQDNISDCLKVLLQNSAGGHTMDGLISLLPNRVHCRALFENALNMVGYQDNADHLWYSRYENPCSHTCVEGCSCVENYLTDEECVGLKARRRAKLMHLTRPSNQDPLAVNMVNGATLNPHLGSVVGRSFQSTSTEADKENTEVGENTLDNTSQPPYNPQLGSVIGRSFESTSTVVDEDMYADYMLGSQTQTDSHPPTASQSLAAPSSTDSTPAAATSVLATATQGSSGIRLGPIEIFATVETVPMPSRSTAEASSSGAGKRKRRDNERGTEDEEDVEPSKKKPKIIQRVRNIQAGLAEYDAAQPKIAARGSEGESEAEGEAAVEVEKEGEVDDSATSEKAVVETVETKADEAAAESEEEAPAPANPTQCSGRTRKGRRCGLKKILPSGQRIYDCGKHKP